MPIWRLLLPVSTASSQSGLRQSSSSQISGAVVGLGHSLSALGLAGHIPNWKRATTIGPHCIRFPYRLTVLT